MFNIILLSRSIMVIEFRTFLYFWNLFQLYKFEKYNLFWWEHRTIRSIITEIIHNFCMGERIKENLKNITYVEKIKGFR